MLFDIFAEKLSKIYNALCAQGKNVVALSGGSDSMALLHLCKEWNKGNQLKIIALTVDHGLRKESSEEAKEISLYCKSIGIEHHTLKWEHQEILTNIQEQARTARYELITNWCMENDISLVLTAHHLGDQVEQLLISLVQGAGIYSFKIPGLNKIKNVTFARPLLEVTKDELLEYLTSNNIKWWEDSSNNQPKYLRNILRPLSDKLLKIGEKKRIITSFSNIERAASALSKLSANYIKSHVRFSKLFYAKFDIESYMELEEEIRFSVLRQVIICIGRRNSDLRLESLRIIDQAFNTGSTKNLGGCSIYFSKENCIVVRDFGREIPKKLECKEGIWDNRFRVKSNSVVNVGIISEAELNGILKQQPNLLDFDNEIPTNIKKNIIRSLPAIISLEKVVFIPHIYYYDCAELIVDMQIEFLEMVM